MDMLLQTMGINARFVPGQDAFAQHGEACAVTGADGFIRVICPAYADGKRIGSIVCGPIALECGAGHAARLGVYPANREKELIGRVRLGDHNGARRILNELLAFIFLDTEGNPDIMKARVLELAAVLSRAAVESGADMTRLFGEKYCYLGELGKKDSFEDICQWVVRMLDAFIDAVYDTRNVRASRYLGGVIEYIHSHYAENISLDAVAARIPLSPYYLSHLFKEELGMTYLEYLTRVRIDVAKALLAGGDLRVRDIALAVGYDDSGYFSKVFRKTVGQSPLEYRKLQE